MFRKDATKTNVKQAVSGECVCKMRSSKRNNASIFSHQTLDEVKFWGTGKHLLPLSFMGVSSQGVEREERPNARVLRVKLQYQHNKKKEQNYGWCPKRSKR